mmetsp:Transcript_17349/g.40266  ORF Transcript_17349/g.40266 Transcript_17349/m.40266 type:complete len:207 (-) Transcript_17349:876-1496(-)
MPGQHVVQKQTITPLEESKIRLRCVCVCMCLFLALSCQWLCAFSKENDDMLARVLFWTHQKEAERRESHLVWTSVWVFYLPFDQNLLGFVDPRNDACFCVIVQTPFQQQHFSFSELLLLLHTHVLLIHPEIQKRLRILHGVLFPLLLSSGRKEPYLAIACRSCHSGVLILHHAYCIHASGESSPRFFPFSCVNFKQELPCRNDSSP